MMTCGSRSTFTALGLLALIAACSAGQAGGGSGLETSETNPGSGGSATSVGSGKTTTDGAGGFVLGSGGGGGTGNICDSPADADKDGDGFRGVDGDCNDCDANVNPGAIEVAVSDPMAAPADENCDGMVDNVITSCDDALTLADTDPMDAAKAIDLCETATSGDKKWGVLSAKYVRADGSTAAASKQFGLLNSFGSYVGPQKGNRMLGLSSGRARDASSSVACGTFSCPGYGPGSAPSGFPQDVPNCPGASNINDDVGLQVKVRAPTNATGYSFMFDFYSFEYPEWVCTAYNDQFIALVNPAPSGSINGNISFDSNSNPVSVNLTFFQVCGGCSLGTNGLVGTGFDTWNDAGATGWLKTTAPVKGGEEITIRFAIWDTGDEAYDSTVLIDGFEWIANGGTVSIATQPVPNPK